MPDVPESPPKRKRPAHWPVIESGNRSVIIYLTVCTKNRQPVLACNEAMEHIIQAWHESIHWVVGRFIIMPDHIHLFCSPAIAPVRSLKSWVGFWQSQVSRLWRRPEIKPLWQKDHWDRQLRSGESYSEKWEYVRNNPVRHGNVERPEDWPYQGEIVQLRWHD